MFKEARIKLTAWYLAIIMAISLSFSVVIYVGVNRELNRLGDFQRVRIQRIVNGIPQPGGPTINLDQDVDVISEARGRILAALGLINLSILVLAGAAGYFLAGRTLEPIGEMLEEHKAFISDASHELRTPLTSLKAEIEVALRAKRLNSKEVKELLRSNLDDVNRMQVLSNYLLKLNRYEQGLDLSMSRVDLKEVAQAAIGKTKVKAELHKSVVSGNKDALIELVSILLENAQKYSPKKSTVEVSVRDRVVKVIDHGIGISRVDLPHIFDRFYRSDKSRGTEGYGLGLAIAKSIVDAHGGSISAESKVGRGTTFSVSF